MFNSRGLTRDHNFNTEIVKKKVFNTTTKVCLFLFLNVDVKMMMMIIILLLLLLIIIINTG